MISIGITLLLVAGVAASLMLGATTQYDPQIFWLLRVPRTISGIAVGGGLAVAGTLIQACFGNPLADPYTIGIASAAALGAVIGSLFRGHQLLGSGAMAFVFAIIDLLILAAWLRRSFRHATEVILAGVVSGFFFSSVTTLVMSLVDPATWSSAMVWSMGSLGHLSLAESVATLILVVVVSIVGWMHWKPLDLIAVDELTAESSGVDVAFFRKRIFFLVSVLTAICVSVAGVIGFLGLIAPHLLRRLGLRGHHILIPMSFLGGAGILLCSDVVARMIARPSEIPVGVIMAILGAPFFLLLARTQRGSA